MTNIANNLADLSDVQQKELLVGLLTQGPTRVFPLSLAQQRLWFLDQLYPGNPAYNVPLGLRLRGNLNQGALELSLTELIQRHEILRTRFESDAGRPIQVVSADTAIKLAFVDLIGSPGSDRQWQLHKIGIEEARRSFNLATGPLLRLKLVRLAAEEHILLCVIHHIVCDGWSLEIFVRELAALYAQHCGGPCASLDDLPIQYGDYAGWQQESIARGLFSDQEQYWKQNLAGAPGFLQLPADHDRPSEQTFDGAGQAILIAPELIRRLGDFGHTQRATLFMVLLTVFKMLLHFYAATDDIMVGVPVAGRNRYELEGLVGFFVNTLVLRTDLSGDPCFRDLLLRVREVCLNAFAHADLPFEKLVEEINPERTLSYSPVIQVMFSAVKARKYPCLGDLLVSPYIFDSRTSLFDLSMEFIEDAANCSWLRVEYDTSLFSNTRIERMLNDYLMLLKAIAKEPELRISRLISQLELEGDVATHSKHPPKAQATAPAARPNGKAVRSRSKEEAEPRDALEQILVRIWEQVLGGTGIRIDDNFFDLGGHSLMAARLVSEVEKAVGRPIPLSALFRGSTIESLAEIIRSDTASNPDPLIMELNAGAEGTPLFAIVQPGWNALGYALLARYIGSGRQFYKLQSHDPAFVKVPLSIEELRTVAREYVAAMRAVHPTGPYFLLGMCQGAHIAEQMVLELESQGQHVGFLGIIDTFVLQHSQIRWLVRLDSFRRSRRNVSRLPLLAQASHYKQAIGRHLRQIFLRERHPLTPWDNALWPGQEFQARRFHAPVVLFRRPKQPYFNVKDREMGWGARTLAEVEICTVNEAAHVEMLREPATKVIAAYIKDALHRKESIPN
jgi:thioesterase domain-containing protein/acyl carrier protein